MDSKRIAVARSRVYIIVTAVAALLGTALATGPIPQYTAAEAPRHIGEKATVVGKVECIDAGGTFHCLCLDGCLKTSPFWIIVKDDASGPELNVNELKGVTIAVSGKIERPQTQPWLVVKSTTQIVPRTKLNPDYLGRARQKESQGDLDGAIAEFDHAIELNHESTAYIERAEVHMKKSDLDSAISDYDQLIERYPEGVYYLKRAGLKMKKSDYAGVVADSSRAIELLTRHYASHPNDHSTFILAQAYSERGEAKEAMGDSMGAVADYQSAIKTEPHNSIYKEKLKHAQAQAAGSRGGNSQPGDRPQSATALVTQAKTKLAAGDFDGAIADCDRALQLSRGGSKEASGLRIQAMRAKGTSQAAVAQRVNPGRSQEEQPIAPTTKSGPAVAAGEARPKATSAVLVDPTSGQPIGRETYNGSVKVVYSDGRSEIFCEDGNCAHPHVSHKGHVGWTHYTHRGNRNAPMNQRLVIRFSNGQTKEFKPNPNGGPFIEEWNFIDNDVAVAIKSRGYHGAASFVRYDLISGRMTGHQDAYVEYEKMPEWAQPFSDDIPFGLHAPTTEPGPAASKPVSAEVVDIPAQAGASQKHEQLLNKSQITPESIAEAFVQAYSAADVDAVADLYADRVDHTNSGVISNAAERAQAKEYFARWPVRHWSLLGTVNTVSLGATKQKVIFSASYDASDPQTNRHASGIAQETLILASDKSGAIKIVSQKEQTSKRGSSQPAEQTSEDLDFDVAKAEYGQQTGFACKLVGRRSDIQLPRGYAQCHLENGVEILRGNDNVPAVNSSFGVRWAAALGPDGKLLWAAKVPYKPPRLGYGLATNGDHLWETAVLDNGVFQLARFKAGTLEREASVQTAFQVTENAGIRTVPAFEFQSQTEGDLQVSVHRTFGDSAKVVVFSRELRPILDKIYSVPDRLAGSGYLIRLRDRTGYYLVIQPQVSKGKRGPRIGIIRLDNTGATKWANTYNTGYSDNDITTRVTNDGALLANWGDGRSTLMKISPDGTINWATTIEGIFISFGDSEYDSPAPYRFTEPSLLAVGIKQDETDQPWWLTKKYSVLFRLNYETGTIEKQIKFGANTPGNCSFVEHDANSFYVAFGNEEWLDKPTGHGSRPNRVKDHGAALRFDYDFNLLAARKIRDAGPILVFFHLFAADRGVISYPDAAKGTLMVETTNANFESSSGCPWFEKENFTFTKSNFQQHPTHVDSSPLTVTVSDANSKLSEADVTVVPLDLQAIPCQTKK
ncbi:MAG TPA: tetratricopeptide repeat protein [Candidatus Udaeobacter sp.]|jgi:hypothetical protein